ncbi:MAG: glycosyltransferase family 39 protein, partial [Phycisphaerales bacterium]
VVTLRSLERMAGLTKLRGMWLKSRPAWQLLIVSAAVHAVVLLVVLGRTGSIDGYAFSSLDCGEFYKIAQKVAEHGVFSQDEAPPLKPDTWRTPGYPVFLAVFMFLLGDSTATLVVVQQVLSILNVLLLFWIAGPLMNTRRAMLVAVLFLLEPYHLFYSLWLMSTTLFVTVLLLTWFVWLRVLKTRHVGWCALLGLLAGFSVLIRPVAFLVPIVIVAGLTAAALLAIREGSRKGATPPLSPPGREGGSGARAVSSGQAVPRPRPLRLAWRAPFLFAVFCMLVLASWMMRNQLVAGHLALSYQGGVVLAYFKATEVVLWRQGRTADRYLETTLDPARTESPHTVWEQIDTRLRDKFSSIPEDQRAALRWQNLAQGNKTTVDSFAVSEALGEIGWSYLSASPLTTAICCLVRCGSVLTFPLNLALKPPTGVQVDRLESTAKGIPYLLLCVWVLVRLFRGGFGSFRIYFPLACTVALLAATTPQIDPRFRVPIIPLLLVVALLPKLTSPSHT